MKANKLTHAYRESKFLFDEKVGIYEALGKIQNGAAVVKAMEEFRQRPDEAKSSGAAGALTEKYAAGLVGMGKDLITLEEQLKK